MHLGTPRIAEEDLEAALGGQEWRVKFDDEEPTI